MRVMKVGTQQNGEDASGAFSTAPTSVEWQNIDILLTRSDLVSFLDLLGFEGAYHDVCVVIDGSGYSTGLAVVTFYSMTQAHAFQALVHGKVGKVFGNAAQPSFVVIKPKEEEMTEQVRSEASSDDADAQDLILSSLLNYFQEATQKAMQKQPGMESLFQGPTSGKLNAPPQVTAPAAKSFTNKMPQPEPEAPNGKRFHAPPGLEDQCIAEASTWPQGVTTAMIRNIACRFLKEDVMEVLDSLGFQGRYDGVRVPKKPLMKCNLGYAFVNFTTAEDAELCHHALRGRTFGDSYSTKLCEVVPARIQGALSLATKARRRGSGGKQASTPPSPPSPTCGLPSFRLAELAQPDEAHPSLTNVVCISV